MQNKQLNRVLALCGEAKELQKIAWRQTTEFIYGRLGYIEDGERKIRVIQGVSRKQSYN